MDGLGVVFFWRWGWWMMVVVSGGGCGIITQLSFPKCICSCVCMGPSDLFLTITCLYCLFSSSSLSLCNQVNSYSQTWQLLEQDVKCWDIYSSCSGIVACGQSFVQTDSLPAMWLSMFSADCLRVQDCLQGYIKVILLYNCVYCFHSLDGIIFWH